jgi:hypothetical protein
MSGFYLTPTLRARTTRFAGVLALLCALSPLSAEKARVDFDHAFNFSQLRTFRWAQQDGTPLNQLMDERIMGFVEEALAAKGLRRVTTGGDLLINFQMKLQEQYITYTNGYGWGWDWGWGNSISTTTVDPVKLGTLVVDLVDARSGRLVFQGVATGSIGSRPEKNTKKLAKMVNKTFEKYPPR